MCPNSVRTGHQEKSQKVWSYEWSTLSAASAGFSLVVSPKHKISMSHQYNALAEELMVQ